MNKKFLEELMDDIGNKLREDYDIEPCTDNSRIDLQEIVTKAEHLLIGKDDIVYSNVIHVVIQEHLKENNIEY